MKLELNHEEAAILVAILDNVEETTRCLSVAEQIGICYEENGDFNRETADKTDATFKTLHNKVRG